MNKRIIGVLIAIGIIFGGIILFTQTAKQPTSQTTDSTLQKHADAVKFHEQYPLTKANNRFIYASTQRVLGILEKGSGLVFLGFPSCPWCQQFAPILDEAATQGKLPAIYYLNIREAQAQDPETYQKIVNTLKDHLKTDEEGNPRVYVPDITAVRQGTIVGRFNRESSADDEQPVTPESYWQVEGRRERAIAQLQNLIQSIQIPQDASSMSKDGSQLIDVRTPAEFAAGHIVRAKNIPLNDILANKLPDSITKDSPIYVYCRSGSRSHQAAKHLIEAGYTNVYDLGSMQDVAQLGLSVEK